MNYHQIFLLVLLCFSRNGKTTTTTTGVVAVVAAATSRSGTTAGFVAFSSRRAGRQTYPSVCRPQVPPPPHSSLVVLCGSSTFNNDTAVPSFSSSSDPGAIEHVDFWGTVTRKSSSQSSEDDCNGPPPCVPSLDPLDGPLPSGAFLKPIDSHYDPKPMCRLSVGIDYLSQPNRDSKTLVRNMQRFIDAGLTTFQLASGNNNGDEAWGEEELYGRLVQETPAHVVKDCHLVVPWSVNFPNNNNQQTNNNNMGDNDNGFFISKQSMREVVLEKLQRTRGDSIDTLLLNFDYSSPESASYLMDILDYLTDLQREGYIRSIGITGNKDNNNNNDKRNNNNPTKNKKTSKRNDPLSNLLQTANNYGFVIDTVQLQGNVLAPPRLPKAVGSASSSTNRRSPILSLSSPLVGGFLTDQHVGKFLLPSPTDLTHSERRHWQTTLSTWGQRQREQKDIDHSWTRQELWQRYQQDVLDETMGYIALKHQVSIASVALRWALQSTPRGNAMATCNLGMTEDDERQDSRLSLKHRPKRLREVFRFELDEEDMEQLEEVAFRRGNSSNSNNKDDFSFDNIEEMEREFFLYQDEIMEQHERRKLETDEYPSIDFNNQQLWL